jgi:uncharacterized membrane protein YoaT (DUF817 family)
MPIGVVFNALKLYCSCFIAFTKHFIIGIDLKLTVLLYKVLMRSNIFFAPRKHTNKLRLFLRKIYSAFCKNTYKKRNTMTEFT